MTVFNRQDVWEILFDKVGTNELLSEENILFISQRIYAILNREITNPIKEELFLKVIEDLNTQINTEEIYDSFKLLLNEQDKEIFQKLQDIYTKDWRKIRPLKEFIRENDLLTKVTDSSLKRVLMKVYDSNNFIEATVFEPKAYINTLPDNIKVITALVDVRKALLGLL